MLVSLFKKIVPYLWLLPGFLLWASFPPMGERFDCFFALAPLLWFSRKGEVRRSVLLWLVNGLLFWVATLSWFPAIVKNNGPWPLVVLGWFGLAAYCSLYFGLFGLLSSLYWRWTKNKSENSTTVHCSLFTVRFMGLLLVEPILWCGLELVRSRFLGGFAWNQLGVAPINAGFGAPAALGGVYLVSAVVILVNGTIASIAERFLHRDRRWYRTLETLLPFILIIGIYSIHSPIPTSNSNSMPLSVALVQRNFPCCFSSAERENPVIAYSNLCANVAYLKPDLVVLPESAYAEIGQLDRRNAVNFSQWLMDLTGAKAIIAGGGRVASDGKIYNSAALYVSEKIGEEIGSTVNCKVSIYDKVHLVPFGEFIPGDKWITALQKLAPVGSCTPGGLKTLSLPLSNSSSSLQLGTAICYEDTDSAQMRELVRMGARALVFITNDSWFSDSQEAISHAWQATARAIETGLPVIRVGNSGVTGVIYPDGKASWLYGPNSRPLVDAPGTLFERVNIHSSTSTSHFNYPPYVLLGDYPLGIAFTLLILGYILIYFWSNYEKRRIVSLQIR